jgi:hypothetical protein
MTDRSPSGERPTRRRMISHGHRKRSLIPWLIPLAIIIIVMIVLPRLAEFFGG